MKKIFFALLTVTSLTAFAQQPILVTMDSLRSSDNSQNSFRVDIPQVTLKDVEHDWLKCVGKRDKGKASVVNGVHIQEGAVKKNISPKPFTLYSKLTETLAGVRLTVWLRENNIDSASGVSNGSQELAVQKFMQDFAISAYRQVVKEELKAERHKLRNLETDMSRAINEQEKYNKAIKKNERANDRDDAVIATNKRDIQRITENITGQKKMVEMTDSDPNATKGAKKTLGVMEDKKKDLQKENEKKSKDIADRNKETRAADRAMDAAHQVHDAKAAAIDLQRQVVIAVKRKLDGVK